MSGEDLRQAEREDAVAVLLKEGDYRLPPRLRRVQHWVTTVALPMLPRDRDRVSLRLSAASRHLCTLVSASASRSYGGITARRLATPPKAVRYPRMNRIAMPLRREAHQAGQLLLQATRPL